MRHAAQHPTTLVVLYKSMLQLALDCGAQQKKCMILKTVLTPYDNRSKRKDN